MILEDLLGYMTLKGESARVSEVCVGLGYTYVQAEDGRVGVSYTLLGRDKRQNSSFQKTPWREASGLLR